MALLANDAADRAEQLILLTDRLANLVATEADRVEARMPPLEGEEAEEKNRLANAYRLELARIKLDPDLLRDAPMPLLSKLKARTAALHETLARHDVALSAMKLIAEGLVQAMAEEVARQRNATRGYGAGGAAAESGRAAPVALDRLA